MKTQAYQSERNRKVGLIGLRVLPSRKPSTSEVRQLYLEGTRMTISGRSKDPKLIRKGNLVSRFELIL